LVTALRKEEIGSFLTTFKFPIPAATVRGLLSIAATLILSAAQLLMLNNVIIPFEMAKCAVIIT
jgi:hypothetical protein